MSGEASGEDWSSQVFFLAMLAELLREAYSICRAMHIFKAIYLPAWLIARLYGKYPSYVRACIAHASKAGGLEPTQAIPPHVYLEYEDLTRTCRDAEDLSVVCQTFLTSLFLYNVARKAFHVTLYAHLAWWFTVVHRIVYPQVYAFLRTLYGDKYLEKVMNVDYRGKRWRVGAGAVLYAYVLLAYTLMETGYFNIERAEDVRRTLRRLTRIDPLGRELTHTTRLLNVMTLSLIAEKRGEVKEGPRGEV